VIKNQINISSDSARDWVPDQRGHLPQCSGLWQLEIGDWMLFQL